MEHEEILQPEGLPWLIFRLNKGLYGINTQLIASISVLPEEITAIPQTAAYFRGITSLRGEVIPLIDLRTLMSMPSLDQEYEQFKLMLDQRKIDHQNWVSELERSVNENTQFNLPTDPHQCKFGQWYDHYQSNNFTVTSHLKKIDEPHKKLHYTAEKIQQCSQNVSDGQQVQCIKVALHDATVVLMPKIISLIEETKSIFWYDNRQMLVILERLNQRIGIIVDEIVCIEDIEKITSDADELLFQRGEYVVGVAKRKTEAGNILVVQADRFFEVL